MTEQKSLFSNSIYNLIKTFSGLVFPIVTFSYSARILGETGIGRVNFSRSVISYFAMFAQMGMNYYGTREAAKLRNNKEQLSRFTHEMLLVNLCTTILAYVSLFAIMYKVPKLDGYESLLLLCSLTILLQGLGMEWLYQALEEFHYIAMRSVIFQICALFALFAFVRTSDDIIQYAAITLFASSGSYVMNFIHSRKYIDFHRFPHYEIKKHIKPILWLFAMTVSIELYTVLDSTMIGFIKGDASVGRYTAAVKVNKMVISLITSFGMVLIPRLSYYIGQGEDKKVESTVRQALNYVFMLSVPATIGLFALSNEIILLFSGSGFSAAGTTMRILTPIVAIIPVSTFINLQVFVPKAKEKLILLSTCTGAVTNFICNLYLIPRFAENGAAVATVLAEFMVTVVCIINIGKFYNRRRLFSEYHRYWIASLPVVVASILLRRLPVHYIFRMIITIACSTMCYAGMLFLQKNTYFLTAFRALKEKLNASRNGKGLG